MKIAYLLIAYMDPEELGRLSRSLVRTADVYIHINASVDIQPFQKAVSGINGRVCFSKERYKVVWGGYSILQATFCMLEEALEYADYDRVILMTGLDYPIKSDKYIQEFFQKHSDVEFVHAGIVTGEMYDHLYYYDYRDNRFLHKIFSGLTEVLMRMGKKGRPDYIRFKGKNYSLYGKAPKWAISGECARYLLDFYKQNQVWNRYFCFMHAPDDFYVSTVLFHSRFKERIDSEHNIFKIMWLPEDRGAKVLTEEEFPELLRCEQLYAKKFQSNGSEGLQSLLENEFAKEV